MAGLLTAETCAPGALTAAQREEMLRLFQAHYHQADAAAFESDLLEKQHVILLRESAARLVGFSTIGVWTESFEGQPIQVMFSGDTIIHPANWGSTALATAWLRLAAEVKRNQPGLPLYWFLIVKGYRTYRHLQVFARTYYPHGRETTPPDLQALMDHLARQRFGVDYDPRRGLVHHAEPRDVLRNDLAQPAPKDEARPEVQFFFDRNPGHTQGDELVCLAEIAADNLTPFARRIFEAAS